MYNLFMLYVWLAMLLVFDLACLSLVLFALPGNWLMVITTLLFAWWRSADHIFSPYTLAAIVFFAFAAELVEFLAGAGTARKRGATLLGSIGAIIGAITGALFGTFLIPLPVVGTFAGACLGAGLGVLALERLSGTDAQIAYKLGRGAAAGQLAGILVKMCTGMLIWFIIAIAAFWP